MEKRIETATEIITVDCNNVLHVEMKVNMPRNFSFANIGKDIIDRNMPTLPALHSLFVDDDIVARGTMEQLKLIAAGYSDNQSIIIC